MIVLFGLAVLTGAVPVFSVEVFLVAMLATQPEHHWWVAGPIAAGGQLLGKSAHYLAARGLIELPRLVRGSAATGGRWTGYADRFRETCTGRPRRTGAVIAVSALLGVPPFGLVVVLAGLTRVPLVLLVPASVVGRTARFSAIAAAPQLVELWWF